MHEANLANLSRTLAPLANEKNIAMGNNITSSTSANHRAIKSHSTPSQGVSSALSEITVEARRSPRLPRSAHGANQMSQPSSTQAGDGIQLGRVDGSDDDLFLLPIRRYGLACDPNTPPTRLEALADIDDLDLKRAVARNANTPEDTLKRLAEDPHLLVKRAVARNANTPEATLDQLADSDDLDLKTAVASNINASTATLDKLANDSNEYVQSLVAGNVNTPRATLKRFFLSALSALSVERDSDSINIMFALARNPSTDVDLLSRLADLNADECNWTGDECIVVRLLVAGNHNTPPDTLEILADHEYIDVQKAVASNSRTPRATLVKLAHQVIEIASNENTPQQTLQNLYPLLKSLALNLAEALLAKALIDMKLAFARNPNTPEDVLKELFDDGDLEVACAARTSYAGSSQEDLDGVLLNVGFASRNGFIFDIERIMFDVARHRNTSPDKLDKLASSEYVLVRRAVAFNHSTPESVLEKLFEENKPQQVRDENLIMILANNGNTPADILEKLAAFEYAKAFVARNKSTSLSVLRTLADVPGVPVRLGVASNMNTPLCLLDKLFEDQNHGVVQMAKANHPNTTSDELDALLKAVNDKKIAYENASAYAMLRHCVALHRNASTNALESLVADENPSVSDAATLNLKVRHAV